MNIWLMYQQVGNLCSELQTTAESDQSININCFIQKKKIIIPKVFRESFVSIFEMLLTFPLRMEMFPKT
jgi:hypothetical protein